MPTQNFVTVYANFADSITGEVDHDARITFTESFQILDTDDVTIRTPKSYTYTAAQLATGAGIRILATDDVNANPSSWYYTVHESWSGLTKNVVIPSDAPGGVLNYATLATATDVPITIPTIVRRVNGVSPDSAGDIVIDIPDPGAGGGGGAPTGAAGGVLAGTYPNPGFAQPMATTAAANALVANAARPRGPWVTGTAYAVNDVVVYRRSAEPAGSTELYRCFVAHTSSGTSLDFSKFEAWAISTVRGDLRYMPQPWAANTTYAAGQVVKRPADNALVQAKLQFTSQPVYDGTNWDYLAGGTQNVSAAPETPILKTASYTLQLTDAGKLIEVNSSAFASVTIPPHSLVPFPLGTVVRVRQVGSTQALIQAGGAVTIRTPWTLRTREQWSTIRLSKRGYHEWVLEEDLASSVSAPATSSGTIPITFSSTDHTVDSRLFNYAVTGYTGQSGDIRDSASLQTSAGLLGPGHVRLGMKWNATAGKPYNGAQGGVNDSRGIDGWIDGIYAAHPTARIVALVEGEEEMGATPAEAVLMLNYCNSYCTTKGYPLIKDWAVGNEPDNRIGTPAVAKKDYKARDLYPDGRVYGDLFCEIGGAMKAADSTIRLWGPTVAALGGRMKADPTQATSPGALTQYVNDFLGATGYGTSVATLLDVLCWHKYMSGTSGDVVTTAGLMPKAAENYSEVFNAKTLIGALSAYSSKVSTLKYSINEWNIFYQPANGRNGVKDEFGNWYDERPTTAEGAVFAASALRSSYRQPSHYFFFFGDIVGPLGLWTRNPYDLTATPPLYGDNMGSNPVKHYPHGRAALQPYAPYWGIAMFTGAPLGIRKFGTTIPTLPTHSVTNVLVMAASDNGGDVVLINQDETATKRVNVTTTGITSGPVDVWQTQRHAPFDKPIKLGSTSIVSSTISDLLLPPMTVTRLVINP